MDAQWMTFKKLKHHQNNIYSQGGEDGVLQFILENIGPMKNYCVDLGASPNGRTNSNTCHLREMGWESCLVDGAASPGSAIYSPWLTTENVNDLLDQWHVPREVGVLSLDLDGNDWWIWQRLQLRSTIAIVEINPQWPLKTRKTIRYNPEHRYDGTMYYGASLAAMAKLAHAKGMKLVWQNMLNCIFVQADLLPPQFDETICLRTYQIHRGHHAPDTQNRPWVTV